MLEISSKSILIILTAAIAMGYMIDSMLRQWIAYNLIGRAKELSSSAYKIVDRIIGERRLKWVWVLFSTSLIFGVFALSLFADAAENTFLAYFFVAVSISSAFLYFILFFRTYEKAFREIDKILEEKSR